MNYGEKLSKEDATALIALLSEHLKIRRPKVVFTGRRNSGRYFWRGGRAMIRLAPKGELWVVAHEFAHHLDYKTNKVTDLHVRWWSAAPNRFNGGHTESFYRNLKRVVAVLGGEYPWNGEYKTLARWAAKERASG